MDSELTMAQEARMPKPKIAVLIRQPLRQRILSDDDLAKLEEVADV